MRVCSVCRRCYDDSVAVCGDEMHPPLSDVREGSLDGIAGYRIVTLIESGCGGAIYRAVRIDSGQSCLVRLLSADEKTTEQFLREAKLAASLFHPSIVDTYEVGSIDSGEVFVVSEDADGRTLREFLVDRGTPELLTSIEIIRQAAEALHTLHRNGFTHGSVRPENIILTTDNDRGLLVRMQHIDFGGVISGSIIANKFLIDSALNSLRYFSPEQCSGSERSAQADIYSLGIVFYELLAGAPPFDASKAVGLIEKHRSQTVPDIRIDNFELRMLITHSLMEALQKQPRMRQSSANLLARQLRHIEQLATHVSTPPPAGVVRKPVLPKKPVLVSPTSKGARRAQIAIDTPPTQNESTPPQPVRAEIYPVTRVADTPPDVLAEPVAKKPIMAASSRVRLSSWKKKVKTLAVDLASEIKPRAASIFASKETTHVDLSIEASPAGNEALPERKKVEWKTPDDDIPSEAAVLAIRTNEGIGEGAFREGVIGAPVEAPSVGDPVIEVPSIAAPVVELAKIEDPVVEVPRIAEPIVEVGEVDAPVIEVANIAEQVREVEAPIVAATKLEEPIAEVAKIVAAEIPAVEKLTLTTPDLAKPKPVRVAKPKKAATKKASSTSVAAKVKPAVTEPVAVVSGMDAHAIRPTTKARPRSGLGFKVNLADLEEITLVRPPSKRIKIDWDRAVARPDLSNFRPVQSSARPSREIAFSPTILGSTSKTKIVERESRDEMFGAYAGESTSSRSLPYRSMTLGGVIAIAIGLVLFSSDSVTKYFQSWSSADSVATSTKSAGDDTSTAAAALTNPLVTKRAVKNSETRAPSIISEKPSNERLRASDTLTVAPKVAAPARPSETKKKDPAAGDVKKSDEKKVPGVSTRPRIVNVPN